MKSKMINTKMLREKISSLEATNRILQKKLKETQKPKLRTRTAINEVNDYCKANDCSVILNNNKLITKIKPNKTFDYPDYLKSKEKKMKNLNIKINKKIPENTSLDKVYEIVKKSTANLDPKACVSWEVDNDETDPEKLLSLGAQEKLKNRNSSSPFEDIFDDFFGYDIKERVTLRAKIRGLEKEIKRLKNAKTNKKRKRKLKKTKQTKKTNKR